MAQLAPLIDSRLLKNTNSRYKLDSKGTSVRARVLMTLAALEDLLV